MSVCARGWPLDAAARRPMPPCTFQTHALGVERTPTYDMLASRARPWPSVLLIAHEVISANGLSTNRLVNRTSLIPPATHLIEAVSFPELNSPRMCTEYSEGAVIIPTESSRDKS